MSSSTLDRCRYLSIASLALISSHALAQGPVQERILGQRIQVPAISERITVKAIENSQGAFTALRSATLSRVFGVVIDELGVVQPSSGVVLIRSIQDGRTTARTEVDAVGQFHVRGLQPGLYSAQLVSPAGSVLTTTQSFTVGAGELVQLTPVISRHTIGGLAQVLGNSTAAAVNSAVSAGVLTVAPLPPASPEA